MKVALSTYVHFHIFVPSVHKDVLTYWPWEHLCWDAGEEWGNGLLYCFPLQVKIYQVCNFRRFCISQHEIPIFDSTWAPADSVPLHTSTVNAKCLLVTKGLDFLICKIGLKPYSQYYLISYVKALCEMRKSLLLLTWKPNLKKGNKEET